MKRHVVILAIALLVVGWLAWPYISMFQIKRAIDSRDRIALERHVSWNSVRQGIKDDLNAIFAHASGAQQDKTNPFSGLALALMPAMVNQMVDSYMTPSGLAALMRQRGVDLDSPQPESAPNERKEQKSLEIENVKYAFFTGPTAFLVELADVENQEAPRLKVMMRFEDFGWRIARIYLPVEWIMKEQDQRSGAPKN